MKIKCIIPASLIKHNDVCSTYSNSTLDLTLEFDYIPRMGDIIKMPFSYLKNYKECSDESIAWFGNLYMKVDQVIYDVLNHSINLILKDNINSI